MGVVGIAIKGFGKALKKLVTRELKKWISLQLKLLQKVIPQEKN